MKEIIYEVEGLLPETVVIRVRKQLQISEDLDTEVDRAAKTYGFYAVLAEKAETRYQKIKFACETWIAETEATAHSERYREKLKAYTEAQMKAHVRSQAKYRAFQIKLIRFDEHRRVLKIIAKAFELKKDLIQTKAANRRREDRG